MLILLLDEVEPAVFSASSVYAKIANQAAASRINYTFMEIYLFAFLPKVIKK